MRALGTQSRVGREQVQKIANNCQYYNAPDSDACIEMGMLKALFDKL